MRAEHTDAAFDRGAAARRPDLTAFLGAMLAYGMFYSAYFLRSFSSGDYIAPSDSLDCGLSTFLSPQHVWTEGMYCGYPVAADPQSLMWYPPFRALRAIGLWNPFMVMPYVVASSTCFLLVRRLTGSTLAGVFSGLVFGFGGPMLAHISHYNQIHAASWLPLVVYGLQLIREGRARAGVLAGSIAFALMLMAGHPQNAVYAVYLCLALGGGWILIDESPRDTVVRRVVAAGVMLGLGTAIAAVTVIPMMELAELSPRAAPSWERYIDKALPPWQLLTLIFPLSFGGFRFSADLAVDYVGDSSPGEMTGYVGLLPLSLALCAPFLVSRSRREAALWLALTVGVAVVALGAATPFGAAFFYAPGYSRFRVPARHLVVSALTCAVAAGVVFAELTGDRRRSRRVGVAVTTTLLIGVAAGGVFVSGSQRVRDLLADNRLYLLSAVGVPLLLGVLWAVAGFAQARLAAGVRWGLAFTASVFTLHLSDMLFYHYVMPGYMFEYAEVEASRVRPIPRIREIGDELRSNGGRVLTVDGSKNSLLLPNLPRAWQINAASGTGPLAIERYQEVMGMGSPGDVQPDTLSSAHLGLDLFGVRYALVPFKGLWRDVDVPLDRWTALDELRYRDDDPATHYRVYRNERVLPRAWCVPSVIHASAAQTLAAIRTGRLFDDRPFDPRAAALVDPDVLPAWPRASAHTSEARVFATSSQSSASPSFEVSTSTECLLVVSAVHYPWWRASVDGIRVIPVRVNHAMVGIPIAEGNHAVRLWLMPVSLWLGAAVTGAGLLAWIAVAAVEYRQSGLCRFRGFRGPKPSAHVAD